MRILFAIPHVYNPSKTGKYASTMPNPAPRIESFKRCVTTLHRLFGGGQYHIDFAREKAFKDRCDSTADLDLVVLTTRGLHLLDKIDLPSGLFRTVALETEPMMLEFECQRILGEAVGSYDFYCFLEDDLVIHDPWFFQKLQWFSGRFGNACLLQPNRFESGPVTGAVRKLYPDGGLRRETTAPFQDLSDTPRLTAECLHRLVSFQRPTNPHAGSFFLNAAQLEHWRRQSYWLDRSTAFIGPLESAASLGIMRAFRIYKAAEPNKDFLEIEHASDSHLGLLGKNLPLAEPFEPGGPLDPRRLAELGPELRRGLRRAKSALTSWI